MISSKYLPDDEVIKSFYIREIEGNQRGDRTDSGDVDDIIAAIKRFVSDSIESAIGSITKKENMEHTIKNLSDSNSYLVDTFKLNLILANDIFPMSVLLEPSIARFATTSFVEFLDVDNQRWYWSVKWQRWEREADEALASGNVESFDNMDDFINTL